MELVILYCDFVALQGYEIAFYSITDFRLVYT